MLQPEDHLESAGAVGAGDRARGVQHRAGRGGHQPGKSAAQDPAGRRFSGMERSVCTSHFYLIFSTQINSTNSCFIETHMALKVFVQ